MSDSKRKINESNLKLESTAPICDKEKYGDYADILHQQVRASDVYNIGIIAPYGAGKSSLIKTYKDTKYNRFKRKRVTTISLANFNASNDEITNSNGNYVSHIQDIECSVEKSILQQFIYKVNKSKLPHSRLDRIDNRHWWLSILIALMMTATIALVCCGVLECLKILPLSSGQNFYYIFGASVISVLCLLFLLLYSHRLNKISVKDIETEICGSENTSVLNTFIDELIYYFKKTKTEIVVVEDLDRFNDTNLFAKLREISFLINNSEIVKQKVTFIYAVKDDLFKNEKDRAKFFDYIISLVPVLSFTNARKLLDNEIKKLCKEDMWLPESYVYEVSHFITEMRILKNVINDYITYYKILKINDFNQKDRNIKLFSLVLYKNLRPADFAELQFGKGKLAEVFKSKEKQDASDIEKLREEISELESRITRAKDIKINSLANFKSLIKGMILDNNEPSSPGVDYHNIKSLTSFKNITGGLTYDQYYTYRCTIKSLESKLGDSLENIEQAILDKEKQSIININSNIEAKRLQIKKLINFSMREFLKLHENFIEDDLINFLLVNGYIAEDYKEFIAHIDQDFLSSGDSEVVRNILAKRTIEYGKKVDNPINVILEIQPERFTDKYVLNYDLVKCLLQFKEDKDDIILKKQNLIEFLSLLDLSAKDFITNYLNDGQDINLLIKEVVLKNKDITSFILQSDEINDENKDIFVCGLFINFTSEQVITQNKDGILKEFLICNKNVIDKIGVANKQLFKAVALKLNIKFRYLMCNSHNYEMANFLVQNHLYEINYNNLEFIACTLKSVVKEDFENAILSAIYDIDDVTVVNYINENLNKVISVVLNSSKNYEESQETLELVLKSGKLPLELCKKFIDKQNRSYNFYDSIDKDILQYLFDNNKIAATWENIILSKKSGLITLTGILDYINKNATELGRQSLENKELILMLCNNIEYPTLKGFSEFSKAFDIELNVSEIDKDAICAILVENEIILSNESNLKNSANKLQTIVKMLIKENKLVDLINTTIFANKTIEGVFLNHELPIELKRELLKVSRFKPESIEALVEVKNILISRPIVDCEKPLLEAIIKNEAISKNDKLLVLTSNDRKLSKVELFTLLKLVDTKLESLTTTKDMKISVGEIDERVLNFLEFKQLYKVTRYKFVIRLVKQF